MACRISLDEYKLSGELFGHSLDVRSVSVNPEKSFVITGSRDKTSKIWQTEGNDFRELITLTNHSNFVSSVYYLESARWIITGSNDKTICVYREDFLLAPFITLVGHNGTVCALSKGCNDKTIVSGSWDATARIWAIDEETCNSTFVELKGHEASVWAVASLPNGNYVTGSADKMIFFWNGKGERLRVLKGHTDCVRGLVALPNNSILSCSNDAVIRHWDSEGECLKEFSGHTNYIYSVAVLRNTNEFDDTIFVTCGEDSTIRMWSLKTGDCLGQPLIIPSQSVWSVDSLPNGDIVAGSSDGLARIFTKNVSRMAPENVMNGYDLAVQTRIAQCTEELGGIKKTDLPGPEALLKPGREGQTKMIRHPNGKVECFSWENEKWNLVGEVMGASGGSQKTSGKPLYDGKEYDYVFNVDISDDAQPLKLPYNLDEDPWHAAQIFIHSNNLPQTYLEQVANFIIKNSNASNVTRPESNSAGYADPFTGESRYTPGANSNNFLSTGNSDPFTGGSSYTTGATHVQPNNIQVDFKKGSSKHFPVNTITTFDNGDRSKILEKLKEFNEKASNSGLNVNEDTLIDVIKLIEISEQEVNKAAVDILHFMLAWPKDILFPVLDITRLAIRSEQIYLFLTGTANFENGKSFLDKVIADNLNSTLANKLMAIRCLANMMKHGNGRQTIETHFDKVVDLIRNCVTNGNANMQIACATFYLNATICQLCKTAAESNRSNCNKLVVGIIELLQWVDDSEAFYRAMQAIGNLSCTSNGPECSALIISADFIMDKIRFYANTPQPTGKEKLNETANALLATF